MTRFSATAPLSVHISSAWLLLLLWFTKEDAFQPAKFKCRFALVGVFLGLILLRVPLNISSFMGIILLVGLVVKNGIILLTYAQERLVAGQPLEIALQKAVILRLRPILMTTLCTLLGLLPLASGLGAGSELQKPLAIAVISGLSVSTAITLLVTPTLFLWIGRLKTKQQRA